jgi:phosphoribosylformylglycinamidine cyclo-ligase
MTYRSSGVDTEQEVGGLEVLRQWVEKTFLLRPKLGAVRLPLGYYANVLDIGHNIGLAISTDGVGTKILIAQAMGKIDTVGIDCVAMNVNDVICVGAEPLAMVDYIAVESADPALLGGLAKGLYRGAELAEISIPGGEVAQIREMIRGVKEGAAFDLVGTCVGIVPLDRILVGQDVQPNDVVVGLRSSGVHSNGLTLARRVFFEQARWALDRHVPELGRTIGEELLEPTRIYVREAMAMLRAGLAVKAFAHITSDGFLNLARAQAEVGYVLDPLPQPQPIFSLIQSCGNVPEAEMFRVFNMGIGFCVVVAPADAAKVEAIARQHGVESAVLGVAVKDPSRRVRIPSRRLVGQDDKFVVE